MVQKARWASTGRQAARAQSKQTSLEILAPWAVAFNLLGGAQTQIQSLVLLRGEAAFGLRRSREESRRHCFVLCVLYFF